MMRVGRVAWIAGAIALAFAGRSLVGSSSNAEGFDTAAAGRLPVLEGGRVKPLDTVARNSLLMIRGKQTVRHEDRSLDATEWLLDVMFRPAVAAKQPVFAIDDPEVLGLMGMEASGRRVFTFEELTPHVQAIQDQANAASVIDSKQRTRFQAAVTVLYDRISLYFRLQNSIQRMRGPTLAAELAAPVDEAAAQRRTKLAHYAYFRPLPPLPGRDPEAWRNVGESLLGAVGDQADPALHLWARLADAWAAQDAGGFGEAAGALAQVAEDRAPGSPRHARNEATFHRAEPFYNGMILYVVALLAAFASWLWRPALLGRVAFGVLAAGAVVHTAGLVSRMVLQGRPPVTNLYSSAVFVGWVAVVLGLLLERGSRRGFATAVAATAGFASLIVAHHLTGDGDTMEMMRAVLDSNFWLATHVVAITTGYGGTFLAGFLAIGYAIRRHVVARPDPATTKSLVGMTYGVICFSLLFSFVGTVLGGIWADQSWGRFWGWDPKENGALLIVLWNAILLHARWGGYIREKGIMAMAIGGNIVTSLSWFGVNMLGVGLHSYGFMDQATWALSGFIGSQLALILLAVAPPRLRPSPAGPGSAP